ncbi:hypothetical protein [Amycolatopsis rubida]|uniref:Uncharacterized protein n=1 Tax=Amycolatopsis rubida TaxID=112413 RepID=A0A1I5IHF6_9PSEU|nr:hypothetical protein [Amycolatopsis rubida]SFO59650.1 hypothetical protein SAMN05421854_102458 [Amycolatopsis rubida]
MDIDALIAKATLPEEVVPLCLRPDLRKKFERLDAELAAARLGRATLAASAEEKKLADELQALESEIAEHTLQVRLRGLTHEPWMKLVAEHPPRADTPGDLAMGMNLETFVPALILAEMVEPEMTVEQFDKLVEVITDNQYENLQNAAWSLSRVDRDGAVFSRAASQVTPGTGEKSRQQSGSGSPRRASRAKKPKS